jgi:periplasmic protein TonB
MTANQSIKAPVELSLTAIFTSAIWMGCIAIGVIGIVIPYASPQEPKAQASAIQAELLNVEMTSEPRVADDVAPAPADPLAPPPVAKAVAPSAAPALIPVAAPNPAIAFELPVAGPTRIVDAKEASYSAPVTQPADNAVAQPPVTQLTLGSGEGKQPQPTYPARALSEGQEGTVRVEFTVGADGRTLAAEIVSQSPWPLLNEAAVKVIRERWRFSPGPVRRYQVPIHFRIRK